MYIKFSYHAESRLVNRLAKVITRDEVVNAISKAGRFGLGETAIKIKRLPSVIKVVDPTDGSVSVGDIVVAVFKRADSNDAGLVTTVELRGSWQPNASRWSTVISLI